MKVKHILLTVSFLTLLSFLPFDAFSQGKAGGGPPPWAPAHGYRAKTRHVYFPDHNFYFDMQRGMYIYLNNGGWAVSASLPSFFSSVNLRSAVQIELDFSGDSPHRHNNDHRVKYKPKQGKGGQGPGKGNGRGRG
jgi:hypothetical protein